MIIVKTTGHFRNIRANEKAGFKIVCTLQLQLCKAQLLGEKTRGNDNSGYIRVAELLFFKNVFL